MSGRLVAEPPPPGQHHGKAAGGGFSPNLYDQTGKLVGQSRLVPEHPSAERAARDEPSLSNLEAAAGEGTPDIAKLVPLALVAVAGIAAGVAGIKITQDRKRRREQARSSAAEDHVVSGAAPAGWYETASDPTRLRYWNGVAWTEEYAQRAAAAMSVPADWYPDPSDATRLRYWDGSTWTQHTSPRPGAVTTPADWYPDPSDPHQLRYWDGTAWTEHVASSPSSAVAVQPADVSSTTNSLAAADRQPRIDMTTAEWQAHVEAWARAGAIQQELWSRLTNARITDADDRVIAAQHQWEALTPQEGARRIQQMLEANPSLRSQSALLEFVELFAGGQPAPKSIDGTARG